MAIPKVLPLTALSVFALVGCNEQQTMTEAIYHQHQKAAQRFADSTAALNTRLTKLCSVLETESAFESDAAEAELEKARQSWQQVMQSWMVLQGREKGSEDALSLSWQIQFWPDKKNTTGRKLNQLLNQDEQWTAEKIIDQSVAVQGVGAVEWFLYEQSEKLKDKSGCELALAIGGRLQQSGNELVLAWQDDPWQQLSPEMALGEYLGALNNQLDYSIKKLTRPLGKPGKPKPYQAESWRSQTSLNNLKANVEAMRQLYLAEGNGLDALLRERGYGEAADRITKRFALLLEGWPQSQAMVPMLKTREGYRELLNIYNGLEYIQIALQDEVAPELGVVVGFNATDGD